MDAIGAIRRARRDLMQKHDLILPFLHAHGMRREVRKPAGQGRKLVIVGRTQATGYRVDRGPIAVRAGQIAWYDVLMRTRQGRE
jgi:hypothetical protein